MKSRQGALFLMGLEVFFQVSTNVFALSHDEYPSHRSLDTFEIPKSAVDPKLGTELTQIYQAYIRSSGDNGGSGPSSPEESKTIVVDITFTDVIDNEQAKEVLREAVEVESASCFDYMCSVRIPVSALKEISNIDSVRKLKKVKAKTHVGSVTSEGDRAMFTDIARSKYSVKGSGLLIGVMSDSYNCLKGEAADIASGDLPSGRNDILIVRDLNETECIDVGGIDEGRAMMQLIYDVAPGARLAFRTAFTGEADFAVGILELALAGCDIIVDDVIYFFEPMFQDGVIAKAVDVVVGQGIPYFSSAGNNARDSWIAPSGFNPVTVNNKTYHQFGTKSDGSPIISMRIDMSPRRNSSSFIFILQWDEPYASFSGAPGSRSDVDFTLYIGNGNVTSTDKNVGADPVEGFEVIPSEFSSNATVSGELQIELVSGPPPTYMKIVAFDTVTYEFPTNSPTSYGHCNAARAAGVGAAYFNETPAFGVSPPLIEFYSSAGGTPILFTEDGTRLSSPEIRNQPRFTGPDGTQTTFFSSNRTGVFRFFGTSASAPHVAALAALMLEYMGGKRSLTPDAIYSTLASTAIDMDDTLTDGFDNGFDFLTGAGFVNGSAALAALVPPAPDPCGLLGLRIFCPLTFCGIFGRLLGLCRN